jgi:hypothetical protein
MRAIVHPHQLIERDVGVALRRGKAGVAQHLLDRAKIGAAFEHVRGARVAQRVRVEIGATRPDLAVSVDE